MFEKFSSRADATFERGKRRSVHGRAGGSRQADERMRSLELWEQEVLAISAEENLAMCQGQLDSLSWISTLRPDVSPRSISP